MIIDIKIYIFKTGFKLSAIYMAFDVLQHIGIIGVSPKGLRKNGKMAEIAAFYIIKKIS